MDEKEKQALIDNAKAEAEQAFQLKLKETEDAKNKILEELKEERKKKQEKEAELDLLKNKGNNDSTNVETVVESILSKKEQEKVSSIKESTIKKFKELNPEFKPENDPAGVKYAAFEKKLARINLDGLASEDEILGALDDAMLLLTKETTKQTTYNNPYASTNQQFSSPKSSSQNGLSSKEENLIKSLGWTEERYLKLKTSKPSYVASLLKNHMN